MSIFFKNIFANIYKVFLVKKINVTYIYRERPGGGGTIGGGYRHTTVIISSPSISKLG